MQIQKIVQNFEFKTYQSNDIVYEKDQSIDKLVIILDGQLKIGEDQYVNNGQLFGETFLTMELSRRKIGHAIFSTRKTTLSELSFRKFFECIGGDLEVVMKKNKDRAGSNSLQEKVQKSDYQYNSLDEFMGLTKLGTGQFGAVFLVKHKVHKTLHAVKALPKVAVL